MLVDRRPSVSVATREGFKAAGWTIDICESDVFEWLCRPRAETADVTVANLFLHHFREGQLAHLLNLAAEQTTRFIACEPRRSRTALAGTSLLPLLGCNDVTLHDARRRSARRVPRSRGIGVVAARRRLAAERTATGSVHACVRRRARRSPLEPPLHLHANPGFRRERQRGMHFGMRRFVEQPKAPALRDDGQQKDTFHPRKRLAHASSRSASERKIRESGTAVVARPRAIGRDRIAPAPESSSRSDEPPRDSSRRAIPRERRNPGLRDFRRRHGRAARPEDTAASIRPAPSG